ncbi:MAG: DUF1475 family protein [Leptospiraceae bacterium]|jgi:hypothetical protein|nr:DUF1475 family protein [Leptospiraceae bacterium]MBL0262812.1 DUF1475 family protein [Leptospiraceae bacterium]MBP9887149.1 DUF1475 family protein [Leptospiraceae bacterium]
MITVLKIIFSFILVSMLYVTTWASLELNLFTHLPTLLKDPWVIATLFDAYYGFITFYLWVCYKENSMIARLLWLIGIMLLGNIAMAIYVLIQLFKLDKDATMTDLLIKK